MHLTCHLPTLRYLPGSLSAGLILRQAKERATRTDEEANQRSGSHPTVKPEVTVSRSTNAKMSGGEFEAQCLLSSMHFGAPLSVRERKEHRRREGAIPRSPGGGSESRLSNTRSPGKEAIA